MDNIGLMSETVNFIQYVIETPKIGNTNNRPNLDAPTNEWTTIE